MFDELDVEDNFNFFLVCHRNRVGGYVKHKINLVWPNVIFRNVILVACTHGTFNYSNYVNQEVFFVVACLSTQQLGKSTWQSVFIITFKCHCGIQQKGDEDTAS